MPQFSDDLFLGAAVTDMGMNLGDPSPMSQGVGPLGRIYVWDVVPAALAVDNISATATNTGALVLAAGAGTTAVTRANGVAVIQLDCPRAVAIYIGAGTAVSRTLTVTGYDVYGQAMSEAITTGTTEEIQVAGQKAFYQIASATLSGDPAVDTSLGTTDILGIPVRVTNAGYVGTVGWNNTLARDAGTFAAADTTSPATTTTNDVRGTYKPSSATDGAKRLVMGVLLPALAVGPNATRNGALGVTQA